MANKDLELCKFEIFKRHGSIVHGIFTREGGTDKAMYDALSQDMNSGNERPAVADNQKRIIRIMGSRPFVFLNQVHEDEIRILKKKHLPQISTPGNVAFTADGMITDMKDLYLVILVADCQAVMLYDPEKKIIANLHSGWRGSIKNIIGKCVEKMTSQFGCRTENIIAGISPSLGPCCAEFVNYRDEIPKSLWKYKIKGRDYFDFWEMSRDQLMNTGIKKEHIENMNVCTKCNTDIFYSFRGEKTQGRFACVISMI